MDKSQRELSFYKEVNMVNVKVCFSLISDPEIVQNLQYSLFYMSELDVSPYPQTVFYYFTSNI